MRLHTEDMPIVTRADCTTIDAHGEFVACPENDLIRGYDQQKLTQSKGTWLPNPNRHGTCSCADFTRDYTAGDENNGNFDEGLGDIALHLLHAKNDIGSGAARIIVLL